jgi:hypothetical protein
MCWICSAWTRASLRSSTSHSLSTPSCKLVSSFACEARLRLIFCAVLGPLRVATAAKDLNLEIVFDPAIDALGSQLQSTQDVCLIWIAPMLTDTCAALGFRRRFAVSTSAIEFMQQRRQIHLYRKRHCPNYPRLQAQSRIRYDQDRGIGVPGTVD